MARLAGVRAEVAGVVGRVRVPAGGVAERRADREQEAAEDAAAAAGAGRVRPWSGSTTDAIRKMTASTGNAYRSKACTRLWPKNAIASCDHDDDDQAQHLRQAGQRVQRERAADAVDREPADAGGDRVQPGRQDVAPVAEAEPGQHHLRHAVRGPARGQHAVRDRAERRCRARSRPARPARSSSPNAATASTPTKIVANSRFGEVQVQNSWSGRPCRSSSGMNSDAAGLDGDDAVTVRALADRVGRDRHRHCRHLRIRCPQWTNLGGADDEASFGPLKSRQNRDRRRCPRTRARGARR